MNFVPASQIEILNLVELFFLKGTLIQPKTVKEFLLVTLNDHDGLVESLKSWTWRLQFFQLLKKGRGDPLPHPALITHLSHKI